MEEQLILDPTDDIKEILTTILHSDKISDIKLEAFEENEFYFLFQDKKYRASIIKLPTIIESYKTADTKQMHKITDISNRLKIWPLDYSEEKINEEKKKLVLSGITPPMKYVKTRRFKKRTKNVIDDNVEQKVYELLKKEHDAIKTTVEMIEEKNIIEELKIERKEEIEKVEESEEAKMFKQKLKDLNEKLEQKKLFLAKAPNIIIKKRFEAMIDELNKEIDEVKENIKKVNN
ncbi:TAFII55 transcription factor family protein [Spraguea lophii 42_110]|uniref:TAFII55 transcription factor family protein n=1 Tax=Spraguea lophii (strain 42_110) TaxID=1358809 RepID=S7XLH2_SPRLO|nr:TAFII55 transcription factor family protein [Spraguea lophii 42_110]